MIRKSSGSIERVANPQSSRGSASKKGRPQTEADWFEKYIIEKTKHDRLIKKLIKLDVDMEELNNMAIDDEDFPKLMNIIVNLDGEESRKMEVQFGSTVRDLREIFKKEFDIETREMILRLKNGDELNTMEQLSGVGAMEITIQFKDQSN